MMMMFGFLLKNMKEEADSKPYMMFVKMIILSQLAFSDSQ